MRQLFKLKKCFEFTKPKVAVKQENEWYHTAGLGPLGAVFRRKLRSIYPFVLPHLYMPCKHGAAPVSLANYTLAKVVHRSTVVWWVAKLGNEALA